MTGALSRVVGRAGPTGGPALAQPASLLGDMAARCDQLCLDVGLQLGEAVPTLTDLTARFNGLSQMLSVGAMPAACESLSAVAQEVAAFGGGLVREGEALDALIDCNHLLAARIAIVDDGIRFLAAIVSNVKVELASIAADTDEVGGFAENLQDMTSRAQTALRSYRDIHSALLDRLRQATRAQADFVQAHRADLVAVARGIEAGLAVVTARRNSIGEAAADIAATAERVGTQIGQSVVALQIGDSIRQRLEHAQAALALCGPMLAGQPPPELAGVPGAATQPWTEQDWAAVAARVCHLQVRQTSEASQSFGGEVATIAALLSDIGGAVAGLQRRSQALFGSDGGAQASFIGDLEPKLRKAQALLEACGQARATVDGIEAIVASAFAELERLAATVASMVADLTTIGTNAIVKAFRLGQRGVGFGIIAQHLRSHALVLADGMRQMGPALQDVLAGGATFARASEGQDAAHIAGLLGRMAAMLGEIKAAGASLTAALALLGEEAGRVGGILHGAVAGLNQVGAVQVGLDEVAEAVADAADAAAPGYTVDAELAGHVGAVLAARYTMPAERSIHTELFPPSLAIARPAAASAAAPAAALEAILL